MKIPKSHSIFLHEDPFPGICIILKDLHANFFGIQQTGDTSVMGVTRWEWKEGERDEVTTKGFNKDTERDCDRFVLLRLIM